MADDMGPEPRLAEPAIAEAIATIGDWMPSGTEPGPAPHIAPWQGRDDRYAYLTLVYGDARRTVRVAVQDFDGCQALIRDVVG